MMEDTGKTKNGKRHNNDRKSRRSTIDTTGIIVDSDGRTTTKVDHGRDRFDVTNKPQFRSRLKGVNTTKIELDDRFSSALTDPRFQLDIKDKFGRISNNGTSVKNQRNKLSSSSKNNELRDFYTVVENQDDEKRNSKHSNNNQIEKKISKGRNNIEVEVEEKNNTREDERNYDSNYDDDDFGSRIAYLNALSRGEVDHSSSSSSSDYEVDDAECCDSSDDSSDLKKGHDDNYHIHDGYSGTVGILDPLSKQQHDGEDVELSYEASPYLAVLNLDWSSIRAVDIYTIVSSFTPPGAVKRVRVYPSDFGIERMKMEESFGPPSTVFKKSLKNLIVDTDNDRDGHGICCSTLDDGIAEDKLAISHQDEESFEKNDDNDQDDDDVENETVAYNEHSTGERQEQSGFDPEKLRAYEAAKLKYYFAIVELTSSEYADMAYKEIDGIEFEHSSAAVDVRTVPLDRMVNVVEGRAVRDEATMIPSNYHPPDFVVNALQHSSVQCSWEVGDVDREKTLTKYSTGPAWEAIAQTDDIKAYLASDASSDDDDEHDDDCTDHNDNKKYPKKKKISNMRKLLGLDSESEDDDMNESENGKERKQSEINNDSCSDDTSTDKDSDVDDDEQSKEVTFVPGTTKYLKEKIMAKSIEAQQGNNLTQKELTPWEKYLEKKRQKKQEKRRALREKRKEVNAIRRGDNSNTLKDKISNEIPPHQNDKGDDVFGNMNEGKHSIRSSKKSKDSRNQSHQELELLLAGDDHDEEFLNYDMRGIVRIDKNKDKKMYGARKHKEEVLASTVTGTEFIVDTTDDRFKSVLDGTDDRFGIDRTDPNFKETPGMRDILEEQVRRRKKRRTNQEIEPLGTSMNSSSSIAVLSSSTNQNHGAATLQSLVSSIKAKVGRGASIK